MRALGLSAGERLDRGAARYQSTNLSLRCLRLLLVLAALLGSGPSATRAAYAEVATASDTVPFAPVASQARAWPSRRSVCARPIPTRSLSRPGLSSVPRRTSRFYLMHRALLR